MLSAVSMAAIRERAQLANNSQCDIYLILVQSNFVFVFSLLLLLKSTFKFDNIADFGELLHFECIHIDKQNKENSYIEVKHYGGNTQNGFGERERDGERIFVFAVLSF